MSSSMADKSYNILFQEIELQRFSLLINIFSVKNERCMCNILMELKICRLQDDIKND